MYFTNGNTEDHTDWVWQGTVLNSNWMCPADSLPGVHSHSILHNGHFPHALPIHVVNTIPCHYHSMSVHNGQCAHTLPILLSGKHNVIHIMLHMYTCDCIACIACDPSLNKVQYLILQTGICPPNKINYHQILFSRDASANYQSSVRWVWLKKNII
jgi:hypothetical protein